MRAIKNHNPEATAARAARKATASKTLVAIALKMLTPHGSSGLRDEELVKRGFAVKLAGCDKCKGMTYATILRGRTKCGATATKGALRTMTGAR